MFLRIFLYTIKRQTRDKEGMIMIMIFPIVLILVLGSALSWAFKPNSIDVLKVSYFNEDTGRAGQEIDGFIFSEEIAGYLDVKKVSSRDEGEKTISDGSSTAFIYIDKDYSDKFLSGEKADIILYLQRANQVSLAIIEGILDSFSNGANTMNAVYVNGLEPAGFARVEAAEKISVSKNGKIPGAIDYYAVTMLAMTLMYGTLYGGIGMGEIFFKNLGQRISTTPANKFKLYLASILGFVFTIFLQGVVILFFTKFVYNVYWGENIPVILLIIFVMSFMAISLGTFVGMLTRDAKITAAILQTLVPVTTFLSSGYFKFQIPNPALKNLVSSVIPNAMAQTALFNSIYGGPVSQISKMILIITGTGILFIFASVLAGRRKRA